MLHLPYAVDAASQCQDLATKILASSSPSQISSSCASLSSFLRSLPPDQCRYFFSLTFPTLICKVFGFGDSNSCGWIDIVNQINDSNLTSTVFSFLSPAGALFQSILAADRHSSVKYVFPTERLPEWSRSMLANESHSQALSLLCPMFTKKIVESLTMSIPLYQVQLNIFEYYIFWFAFYPISKSNAEDSVAASAKRRTKFKLENWTIPCLPASKVENFKSGCNLYLQLLYSYLREFVPVHHVRENAESSCNSLLNYPGDDGMGLLQEQTEFFVDTLVNYWLVDNDCSPLPSNTSKSYGVLSSRKRETPPSANVAQVVKLLVEYMILFSVERERSYSIRTPRQCWVLSPTNSWSSFEHHLFESLYLRFQRAVYRFILRTFLFYPVGASLKNLSEVFSIWISFIEPWKIGKDSFVEHDFLDYESRKVANKGNCVKCGYSGMWESYVLSNYLFYTSLVMHFVGFAHKFLHTDPQAILQMQLKVVDILTSSIELVDLLKKMDSTFHSIQVGSGKSLLGSSNQYAPLIRKQLQDWEDGLSETDVDGSFLHENWNKNLNVFSDGEAGGQQLFKLFIMRAEAVLQTSSGSGLAENLQRLDSFKAKVSSLFGGTTVWSPKSPLQNHQQTQSREEIFTPSKPRVHVLSDDNKRHIGDQMKRPLSDNEIKWLAKLLLKLSCWLNNSLGLTTAVIDNNRQKKQPYVDISTKVANISGAKDTFKVLLMIFCSWCLMLWAGLLNWMRVHGLRINLRVLASKKLLIALMATLLGFRVLLFFITFMKNVIQIAVAA